MDEGRDPDELAKQLAEHLLIAFPTWPVWRGGWPEEADAALVDAVFSTRAKYESTVLPLVRRWIAARNARPELGKGVSALAVAGRDFLAQVVQNDQLVPGRARKLKVDAAIEAAECLLDARVGLDTADEIRERAMTNRGQVRRVIEQVKGIGPAQSSYFLMLLGVQGVKADTMVTSWVQRQLGERSLTQEQIELIVTKASADRRIDKSTIEVDHAIWRAESNRRRTRSHRY